MQMYRIVSNVVWLEDKVCGGLWNSGTGVERQ